MVNKMHLFVQLEAAVERSSVASNNFLLSSVYELEARKNICASHLSQEMFRNKRVKTKKICV